MSIQELWNQHCGLLAAALENVQPWLQHDAEEWADLIACVRENSLEEELKERTDTVIALCGFEYEAVALGLFTRATGVKLPSEIHLVTTMSALKRLARTPDVVCKTRSGCISALRNKLEATADAAKLDPPASIDEWIQVHVIPNDASPPEVFLKLRELSAGIDKFDLDLTGAKKPMVMAAFAFAGFVGMPAWYVDFTDYDEQLGRPSPTSCYLRRLPHPESTFSLRSLDALRLSFDAGDFPTAASQATTYHDALINSGVMSPDDRERAERLLKCCRWAAAWATGLVSNPHACVVECAHAEDASEQQRASSWWETIESVAESETATAENSQPQAQSALELQTWHERLLHDGGACATHLLEQYWRIRLLAGTAGCALEDQLGDSADESEDLRAALVFGCALGEWCLTVLAQAQWQLQADSEPTKRVNGAPERVAAHLHDVWSAIDFHALAEFALIVSLSEPRAPIEASRTVRTRRWPHIQAELRRSNETEHDPDAVPWFKAFESARQLRHRVAHLYAPVRPKTVRRLLFALFQEQDGLTTLGWIVKHALKATNPELAEAFTEDPAIARHRGWIPPLTEHLPFMNFQ